MLTLAAFAKYCVAHITVNISAEYLCQGKAEEGSDVAPSLTDDNAALVQIGGAEFTVNCATQY